MAKNIIGTRESSLLQTNAPTSEKFNCDAMKMIKKKQEDYHKKLLNELERRNYELI